MQNRALTLCIAAAALLCTTQLVFADKILPSIDNRYVEITEENPTRDAGYVVGDILDRTITLTVKKPYELVQESLPIPGYEHRYRGQISGIELARITTETIAHSDSTTHVLHLSYQVFTTGKLAKPAALRAEIVKMRNTEDKKVVQYRIPSFSFRISPLSVFGQVKLKEEMSPFIPPLQIDDDSNILLVKILAAILALSLLGLLYILGMRAWLPRMGAPFAKAYREIRQMPDSVEGIQQATARLHTALNKTAGNSLFNNNLEAFIALKPAFAPMKAQMMQFFDVSHRVFFESAQDQLPPATKAWLLGFCRRLRDCERGLQPDLNSSDANTAQTTTGLLNAGKGL